MLLDAINRLEDYMMILQRVIHVEILACEHPHRLLHAVFSGFRGAGHSDPHLLLEHLAKECNDVLNVIAVTRHLFVTQGEHLRAIKHQAIRGVPGVEG